MAEPRKFTSDAEIAEQVEAFIAAYPELSNTQIQPAFNAGEFDTVNELFDEILNRRPRPPRQLNREILTALDRICCNCLSRDVERRYGSGEDVAIELDKCLATMTVSDQVSIASKRALVIGGLGLIGVGFLMSFVGGFFVWVTYMAMQWAFGGLSTTTEDAAKADKYRSYT